MELKLPDPIINIILKNIFNKSLATIISKINNKEKNKNIILFLEDHYHKIRDHIVENKKFLKNKQVNKNAVTNYNSIIKYTCEKLSILLLNSLYYFYINSLNSKLLITPNELKIKSTSKIYLEKKRSEQFDLIMNEFYSFFLPKKPQTQKSIPAPPPQQSHPIVIQQQSLPPPQQAQSHPVVIHQLPPPTPPKDHSLIKIFSGCQSVTSVLNNLKNIPSEGRIAEIRNILNLMNHKGYFNESGEILSAILPKDHVKFERIRTKIITIKLLLDFNLMYQKSQIDKSFFNNASNNKLWLDYCTATSNSVVPDLSKSLIQIIPRMHYSTLTIDLSFNHTYFDLIQGKRDFEGALYYFLDLLNKDLKNLNGPVKKRNRPRKSKRSSTTTTSTTNVTSASINTPIDVLSPFSNSSDSSILKDFSDLSIDSNNGNPDMNDDPNKDFKKMVRIFFDVTPLNSENIIDIFLKTSPIKFPLLQPNNISILLDQYINHNHYVQSFKPVLVNEFRKQIESNLSQIEKSGVNEDGTIKNLDQILMNNGLTFKNIRKYGVDSFIISFDVDESKVQNSHLIENQLNPKDIVLFKVVDKRTNVMYFAFGLIISCDNFYQRKMKKSRDPLVYRNSVEFKFIHSEDTAGFINLICGNYNRNYIEMFYLKVSNGTTFQREIKALEEIKDNPLFELIKSPSLELHNQLVSSGGSYGNMSSGKLSSYFKLDLNDSQWNAIERSLSKKGISLIQGPPGTGKTHTVLCLISILLSFDPSLKILVCAPSHAAVDEIAKRAIEKGIKHVSVQPKMVRIGFKSHVAPDVYTKIGIPLYCPGKKKKTMIRNSSICFSTLSASDSLLVSKNFAANIVIVDESTQSVESSTIIPIIENKVDKLVLVGDHKQLPPTLFSQESNSCNLDVSLFERLSKKIPLSLLDTQYRMHPSISKFPSKEFYNGQLLDGQNVKQGLYNTLDFHKNLSFGKISFYDVIDSREEKGIKSIRNLLELKLVFALIRKLIQEHPSIKSTGMTIGIITPYKLQKNQLLEAQKDVSHFNQNIKIVIKTIDGFQGGETDIIVFSCVRNERMGFLSDRRRINVALTRSRYGLFIIGNKTLLSKDRTWGKLIEGIPINSIDANGIITMKSNADKHDLLNPNDLLTHNNQDSDDENSDDEDDDNNFNFREEYDYDSEDEDEDDEYQNFNIDTDYPARIINILQRSNNSNDDIDQFKSLVFKIKKYINLFKANNQQSSSSSSTNNGGFFDRCSSFLKNLTQYPAESILENVVNNYLECNQSSIKIKSFNKLKKILNQGYNTKQLYLFGSFLTNTSIHGSDIDVYFSNDQDKESLKQVSSFLKSNNYQIIENRFKANVPIIKFKCNENNIDIDMSFTKTSVFSSYLIREYTSIDKRVKELAMLVKWWAFKKNLNNAQNQSFSSFALINMVIHFLQNVNPPILPNLQNPNHCGIQILSNIKPLVNEIIEGHTIKFYDHKLPFDTKQNKLTISQLFHQFFVYYLNFNYESNYFSISKIGTSSRSASVIEKCDRNDIKDFLLQHPIIQGKNIINLDYFNFKRFLVESSIMEYQLRNQESIENILSPNETLTVGILPNFSIQSIDKLLNQNNNNNN